VHPVAHVTMNDYNNPSSLKVRACARYCSEIFLMEAAEFEGRGNVVEPTPRNFSPKGMETSCFLWSYAPVARCKCEVKFA
jgi:hypothetical protein